MDARLRPFALPSLVVVATLGCSDGAPVSPAVTPPGRVILVSMDTVRADRVSGYGAAKTTPRLASIAEEGVLFANFYSASTYTIPSTMSVFTGLDPGPYLLENAAKLSCHSHGRPLRFQTNLDWMSSIELSR